jgi:hypothetical protein
MFPAERSAKADKLQFVIFDDMRVRKSHIALKKRDRPKVRALF